MHDLCVIVVSHNGKHWLERALGSVYAHAGDIDLDLVVVDNGDDGAAEHVEALFPAARTVRCENRGFAHANNRGLETADARYILFLNPDTEILAGQLGDMVAALDRRLELGLAGVRQVHPEGGLAPSIRRFPSSRHTLAEALGVERIPLLRDLLGERELRWERYSRSVRCDWTSGSFMFARAAALDEVGWLDERYFLFSEETDLCWRLRRAGWQVMHLPDVTILHEEREGEPVPRLEAQNAYGRVQFARAHFTAPAASLYRASLLLRYLLRAGLYATARRDRRGHRAATRAAIRTICGNRSPFEPGAEATLDDDHRALAVDAR